MGDYIFPFITSTPNPIGGCASGNSWGDEGFKLCSFDCHYCWAKGLKNRFKYPKYQGEWRIIEKDLVRYGEDDFPWACDMIDIGDPTIPPRIVHRVLEWIDSQPCPVLLLTKNPAIYRIYSNDIPCNLVLGATVESNLDVTLEYSSAPAPWRRMVELRWLSENLDNRVFVCIEPVMRFEPSDFIKRLEFVEPWAVTLGYDNYGKKLPEPSLETSERFLSVISRFTKVYRKSMRRRWDA